MFIVMELYSTVYFEVQSYLDFGGQKHHLVLLLMMRYISCGGFHLNQENLGSFSERFRYSGS